MPVTTQIDPAPSTSIPAGDASPSGRLEDHVIVLFGATGDLAARKPLPGLFHLDEARLMPERYRIVGVGRRELSDDGFRDLARSAVAEFGRSGAGADAWTRFAGRLSFAATGNGLQQLRGAISAAAAEVGGDPRHLYYLSVPPSAFPGLVADLEQLGLGERARVIVEKPFGRDLASARRLNGTLHRVFDESQVFRIDHYLGKEAVQNLLALRFANGLFEPVWNRNHIDHVQIDVPESLSIDTRAEFYEETGAFRDMVVTHLFQVLSFVALEPPTALEPDQLIAEKRKVFESVRPLSPGDVVRGQHDGYRDLDGVATDSDSDTFVALRTWVDNWRWSGVPFYLRTGKRLAESAHLLTVAFKQPPRRIFPRDCRYMLESFGADHLTLELGDPGSISLNFLAKVPGPRLELGEAHMDFSYKRAFGGTGGGLEAYERLLQDVMLGDRTLFVSGPGIERLWEASAPVLEDPPPVVPYRRGTWGPAEADELIAPRRWHLPGHLVHSGD